MVFYAGEYTLRSLPDDEHTYADQLSQQIKGKNLDYCPTCGSGWPESPDEVPPLRQYYYLSEWHDCDCKTQIALWARYLVAGIPEQYMRLDWGDYEGSPEAQEFVNKYLAKWKAYRQHGFGVEFGGPRLGIGKTFAATAIVKEMVKHRQRALFIPFVEMVSAFERSDAEVVEYKLRMTPYVVLDDIMPPKSDKQANFYHNKFEAIIRHRTNYNLPTIITTNLTTDELDEYYPRTYSLLSAKQKRIDMDGQDFRGIMGLWNIELIENGETRPIT
jgi:DNA replication protein DnaC